MSSSSLVALIIQPSPMQTQLWTQALTSLRFRVISESPRTDLVSYMGIYRPDLLIVDMTTGLFNPYGFCRECRTHYPGLPVILTQQSEQPVEAAARRWAVYQGAADVMPGLTPTATAIDHVERVMQLGGWSAHYDRALLEKVLAIPKPTGPEPIMVDPDPPVVKAPAVVETVMPRSQMMFRGRPV